MEPWQKARVPESGNPPRTNMRIGFAKVGTGSYSQLMTVVSIKEAKNRLTALARLVEKGGTVVVTRNGKPVFHLVPHRAKRGLNLDALRKFKRKHGISRMITYVADDFDEPLPEDFLRSSEPCGSCSIPGSDSDVGLGCGSA
jgi:prevent-host-death family protein